MMLVKDLSARVLLLPIKHVLKLIYFREHAQTCKEINIRKQKESDRCVMNNS